MPFLFFLLNDTVKKVLEQHSLASKYIFHTTVLDISVLYKFKQFVIVVFYIKYGSTYWSKTVQIHTESGPSAKQILSRRRF